VAKLNPVFEYPPESFSRELDMKVQRQEKPYGYTESPPPADSGDYNMKAHESRKEYPVRDRRG